MFADHINHLREVIHSMDEDIWQTELPSGFVIDVGYYPSDDPDGCYQVLTWMKKTWWDRKFELATKSKDEVIERVEKLIKEK